MSDPYHCPGCDLTGKSFAGVDLTDADLQNAILDGASFHGALSMTRAKLGGAKLRGTDFSGCDLTTAVFDAAPKFGVHSGKRTTFHGATISFTSLGRDWSNLDLTAATVLNLPASLTRLKATNAVLPGFAFGKRDLTNAHFRSCDLTGADFSGATLDSAVFTERCTLTRAKFVGARLANAVLDGSTLTGTDFTKAVSLAGASFLQTRMDGTLFDGTDVTSCAFTDPPRFSSTPDLITSFRGATLNLSLIGKQWSFLDLTDATIAGLTKETDLTSLQARYAVFGAMSFAGMTLLEADFTSATFVGTSFAGAKLANARFDEAGARAPQGSTPPKASVVFDNATLTNASFHGAQLPGASFVQAALHGATMTSMGLRNADLTGANLGTQAVLFTVTDAAGRAKLLDALQQQNGSVLAAVLNAHGIPVRRLTVTPASPVPPVTSWTLADDDTQTTYTARSLVLNGQNAISLFNNAASHANLGDTYMPGAILTHANLYGVTASGIHLYGAGTKLDSAILEAVDFSGANLGTANFRQAALADAIFDDAILTNADFSGAMLIPGQAGRGVSFHRANLQGAAFLSAKLYGANLQDAALCFPLPTTPVSTYGVWLFRVGQGDPFYAPVLNELQTAQLLFTLDPESEDELKGGTLSAGFRSAFAKASRNKYSLSPAAVAQAAQYEARHHVTDGPTRYDVVPGIDTSDTAAWQVVPSTASPKPFYIPLYDVRHFVAGPVSRELRDDFQQRGNVTLSASATVGATQAAVAWQINDAANSFELWDGFDGTERQLFARVAMPGLAALFSGRGFRLFRQTVNAAKSGVLEIDNDSANPFGNMLGYVTFNAVPAKDGIDFYGSTMRIQRLADHDRLQYYDVGCGPTKIAPDNFDATTFFPNGRKENAVVDGALDPAWLRAQSPPRPPLCVPNPFSYCPPPAPSSSSSRRGAWNASLASPNETPGA